MLPPTVGARRATALGLWMEPSPLLRANCRPVCGRVSGRPAAAGFGTRGRRASASLPTAAPGGNSSRKSIVNTASTATTTTTSTAKATTTITTGPAQPPGWRQQRASFASYNYTPLGPPGPPPGPPGAGLLPRAGRLLWAGYLLAVAVGTTLGAAGLFVPHTTSPAPGSPEERRAVSEVHRLAEEIPLVRELSAAGSGWESWHAYGSIPEEEEGEEEEEEEEEGEGGRKRRRRHHRGSRLTTGPLAGYRGLAYQRVFHRPETGEMVSVLFFGPGTVGHPFVVHGGATATVLDESLGRCAVRRLAGGTGVTANLEVSYLRPVSARQYKVVRCWPVPEEELPEHERGKGDRKVWCRGRVEDTDGTVLIEAKALFVKPKGLELRRLGPEF